MGCWKQGILPVLLPKLELFLPTLLGMGQDQGSVHPARVSQVSPFLSRKRDERNALVRPLAKI